MLLRLDRALMIALGVGVLGLSGCREPGSTHIVGPDGSQMSHVHCGGDQGECFRIAGELCPGGYEMKPVMSTSDGNFLVRCRATGAPVLAQAAPAASAPVLALAPAPASPANGAALSSTRSTPGQAWPPSTEPWPAAYPWGPPEPSTGTHPAPTKPTGDVDLGY